MFYRCFTHVTMCECNAELKGYVLTYCIWVRTVLVRYVHQSQQLLLFVYFGSRSVIICAVITNYSVGDWGIVCVTLVYILCSRGHHKCFLRDIDDKRWMSPFHGPSITFVHCAQTAEDIDTISFAYDSRTSPPDSVKIWFTAVDPSLPKFCPKMTHPC